ncbi:unnamed protein product [Ranitomeya imitator]|uniref:Uncharacterized protein n=1 Tax=Ranitomeya imitator TaxID=111125 RepID=A0ABN9MQ06_9NEOB|nr:unnamed protein product [Ranitomeya imitator]
MTLAAAFKMDWRGESLRIRDEKREERRRRELERKRLREEERRKWKEDERRKRKEAEKQKKCEKTPEKETERGKDEPKIKCTEPESDPAETMVPRPERYSTLHGDTEEGAHDIEEEVIDDPVVDPDWQPFGEEGAADSSSEAEEDDPQ